MPPTRMRHLRSLCTVLILPISVGLALPTPAFALRAGLEGREADLAAGLEEPAPNLTFTQEEVLAKLARSSLRHHEFLFAISLALERFSQGRWADRTGLELGVGGHDGQPLFDWLSAQGVEMHGIGLDAPRTRGMTKGEIQSSLRADPRQYDFIYADRTLSTYSKGEAEETNTPEDLRDIVTLSRAHLKPGGLLVLTAWGWETERILKNSEIQALGFELVPVIIPKWDQIIQVFRNPTGLEEIELDAQEVGDLSSLFGHLAMRSDGVPVPLDVLIVPGSPAAMTAGFAGEVARRYEQFKPDYVVVTGTEAEARFLREALTAKDIPADPAALLVDAEARHSGDNAEHSAKLLGEQPALKDLARPLRIGLVPAALTSRLIYRFFQSRFAWPSPVEFYMVPPEPLAVTSRMNSVALKSQLDWALRIVEGLATARDNGFVKEDGRAEDLPAEVLAAAERLKELQQRLAVGLEEKVVEGRETQTGLDSQL